MLLEELEEVRGGNGSEPECLDVFSEEEDEVVMASESREISEEEVAFFIRDSREHVVRVVILDVGLEGRVGVVVAEYTHVTLHICHSYLGLDVLEVFSEL